MLMLRTFFDTESYYDTLTIGGQVFSGSLYCINDLIWEFLLSSLFPHATSLWPLDLQPRSSAAGEIIEVSAGFLGLGVHGWGKVVKFGDVL